MPSIIILSMFAGSVCGDSNTSRDVCGLQSTLHTHEMIFWKFQKILIFAFYFADALNMATYGLSERPQNGDVRAIIKVKKRNAILLKLSGNDLLCLQSWLEPTIAAKTIENNTFWQHRHREKMLILELLLLLRVFVVYVCVEENSSGGVCGL